MGGADGSGVSATSPSPDIGSGALLVELLSWYAAEAMLLDERRFDQWLALLADDVRYQVPTRRNRTPDDTADFATWSLDAELSSDADLPFIDDDLAALRSRVDRLRTGTAWAEWPPSRTTRVIGLPLVTGRPAEDEVDVRCPFVLHKDRVESESSLISGFRRDRLRRQAGSWSLARRVVVLNAVILPSHNLSVIL